MHPYVSLSDICLIYTLIKKLLYFGIFVINTSSPKASKPFQLVSYKEKESFIDKEELWKENKFLGLRSPCMSRSSCLRNRFSERSTD